MKSKPLPSLEGPYRKHNMETIPEMQNENIENIPPEQPENHYPNQETTYASSNENIDTRNAADKTITQSEVSNSSVSSPKNPRPFSLHNTSSSKSSSLRF